MSAAFSIDAEFEKYLPMPFFNESNDINSCDEENTDTSRSQNNQCVSLSSPIQAGCLQDIQNRPLSIITKKYLLLSAFACNKKTLQLQKMLNSETVNSNEISTIISTLKGHLSSLMIGRNSNYFMRDLIKKCSKKQKLIILSEIYSAVDTISINEYGTHPIQTLIESASSKEEIIMLINSISTPSKVRSLSMDINGTYIIQKIISYFNENFRRKLNKIIIENILVLSADMYGVCVVKKLILNCSFLPTIQQIWNIFLNNFVFIAENEYGNYAVQIWMEKLKKYDALYQMLNQAIFHNFVRLSNNSYASHIVNTSLNKLNKQQKQELYKNVYSQGWIPQMSINKHGKLIINKLSSSFDCTDREVCEYNLRNLNSETYQVYCGNMLSNSIGFNMKPFVCHNN